MKTKLTILRLLILVGGTIFFSNQIVAADSITNSVSQTNESSPLEIIVTPRKTRVHAGEKFKVALEIKNVSNTSQSFKVWSCSWDDNWKSDNAAVCLPGFACLANWVGDVSVVPGETFKETVSGQNGQEVEMYVSPSVTTNKITFRMCFIPSTWGEIHFYDPVKKIAQTNQWWVEEPKNAYWSDEVTIKINPKSVPDWIPW